MKVFNLNKFNKYSKINNRIPSFQELEKVCKLNKLKPDDFFVEEQHFTLIDFIPNLLEEDIKKINELETRIKIRNKYETLYKKIKE